VERLGEPEVVWQLTGNKYKKPPWEQPNMRAFEKARGFHGYQEFALALPLPSDEEMFAYIPAEIPFGAGRTVEEKQERRALRSEFADRLRQLDPELAEKMDAKTAYRAADEKGRWWS
jgi:hypothetical protein